MAQEQRRTAPRIPSLIYGTADQLRNHSILLSAALSLGYDAVDTASNYGFDEAAVASTVKSAIETKDIHIQTKYSPTYFYRDKSMPYDANDSGPLQILKSVEASLSKLNASSIDLLLLHRPFLSLNQTYAAWEVFEEIYRKCGAKHVGICQTDLVTLETLYANADVKPAVVHNHFAHSGGFDKDVRRFCREKGFIYQCSGLFSKENVALLEQKVVNKAAQKLGVGKHAALFAVLLATAQLEGEELCILDGTRDREHLEENWKAYCGFRSLLDDDIQSFPAILGQDTES